MYKLPGFEPFAVSKNNEKIKILYVIIFYQEGVVIMQSQTVRIVSQVIRYIEHHLNDKMELDTVAAELHYSKFHLHRIFTKTVGLTIHEYIQRRQLTEAAKLLIFSQKPWWFPPSSGFQAVKDKISPLPEISQAWFYTSF